jgi:hypothetical protein
VILLVCLDGLRYEAVAKILDIPFGTVCSRLHRRREELRRLMGHASNPPTWESPTKSETKSQALEVRSAKPPLYI